MPSACPASRGGSAPVFSAETTGAGCAPGHKQSQPAEKPFILPFAPAWRTSKARYAILPHACRGAFAAAGRERKAAGASPARSSAAPSGVIDALPQNHAGRNAQYRSTA